MHYPIRTDMSAFLPRSPAPAERILVDELQDGTASRLVLVALAGAPAPVLARLSVGVATALRRDRGFRLVANGAASGRDADRAFLWNNRYLLSPAVTPERFTVAGLHAALADDLLLLNSDLGILAKRTLPDDPTGEMLRLADALAAAGQPANREGVWFSPDGRRALLFIETRAPGFDIDGQGRALAALGTAFAAVRAATEGAARADLVMTGPAVFAVRARTAIEEDATRLSAVAGLLVAFVLLLAYRSLRLLLVGLVPVASGALAGIAEVGLVFVFVHGITLGFGVTLIGEAVDYPIYLVTQTSPGARPQDTLPRIWPTLRLGVLTSICGFSAMLLSSFTGFAQLGLFTIVGLLAAVGVTRWVVPALLPADFAAVRAPAAVPALFARLGGVPGLRWAVPAAGLAALALLLAHRGGLWETELASLSPIPAAQQALDRSLRRDLGAPDLRYLVVATAADRQQALAASERISTMLTRLVADGAVAGFDAPSRYLPSRAAQLARQAALPPDGVLRARLDAALVGLPFRPGLFAPFLGDAAAARRQAPLTRADLAGTGLAVDLDSLLLQRTGGWTAILPLHGVVDPVQIAASLAGLGDGQAVLVDLKRSSERLLATYLRQAVRLALGGGLVILALLAGGLRSARRVWTVAAPLAAAVLVTAALLSLGGGKLSIFNLVGLLLTVAVGSNYSLFFERQRLGDPHCGRTLVSLGLANLCTVIGFGVLALSRVPVLHGIGGTVALGAFLSLVFSALVAARPAVRQTAAPDYFRPV